MKNKFVLLILALLIINVVHAQWHFTITSMDYNDNCGGSASIEVSIRAGMAEQQAAKMYNSKEDCELGRGVATMNWSSGGCYIRTTTSPCTGGNTGGGGDNGGGGAGGEIGSLQNNASLYSSIAIGEPYFSPNEAQATYNLGRDTEIKLEAWNKNSSSARNGIKTGDTSFDDLYKRLSNMVPENNNDGTYTFNNRKEIDPDMPLYVKTSTIYLGEDNSFISDDDDMIVEIDSLRFTDVDTEESVVEKTLRDDRERNTTGGASTNLIVDAYKYGSGFIKNANDGTKYIKETLGVTIPGGDIISNWNSELNNFESTLDDIKRSLVMPLLGICLVWHLILEK